jgi:sulfur carrier protein ThiS
LKITVKLFGTLETRFSDYDPVKGLEIDIPDGAKVKGLFAHLDIPKIEVCFVSMNHIVAKMEQKLVNNTTVCIFQALAGG